MTDQRRGTRLNSATSTDRLAENSQSTPAHAAAAARFAVGRYYNVSIYIHAMEPRLGRITLQCDTVMSHDNDNARNFVAAAACGTAVVTPLISTWPTSARHIWLDWAQSKNRNKQRYTWLYCRFQ